MLEESVAKLWRSRWWAKQATSLELMKCYLCKKIPKFCSWWWWWWRWWWWCSQVSQPTPGESKVNDFHQIKNVSSAVKSALPSVVCPFFVGQPKSVPLQLTSRETVVAMESDIIATSGWAGWVSGFIRECFKTEPRSINAFFADKFISTMSSWLPASYHPPSRSVHFWTKITPPSHLSKTTSNPICSGKMCSVNPKSTKEPEVLNTFIWEKQHCYSLVWNRNLRRLRGSMQNVHSVQVMI